MWHSLFVDDNPENMWMKQYLSSLFVLLVTVDIVVGEMFNALVEMKTLVDTQRKVANDLMSYVEKEEERLAGIKR